MVQKKPNPAIQFQITHLYLKNKPKLITGWHKCQSTPKSTSNDADQPRQHFNKEMALLGWGYFL